MVVRVVVGVMIGMMVRAIRGDASGRSSTSHTSTPAATSAGEGFQQMVVLVFERFFVEPVALVAPFVLGASLGERRHLTEIAGSLVV